MKQNTAIVTLYICITQLHAYMIEVIFIPKSASKRIYKNKMQTQHTGRHPYATSVLPDSKLNESKSQSHNCIIHVHCLLVGGAVIGC
jgi:hypothetical protein